MYILYYQLPNGKTVYLTVEQYLELSDGDIQYLISLDHGDSILNPFYGSSVDNNEVQKVYDFDFVASTDEEALNISSDDQPFDDIIDLSENLDI